MKIIRCLLKIVCLLLVIVSEATGESGWAPAYLRQYSVTQWGHRDGLPSSTIYAIAQTKDGYLWLGTADGLIRFDGIHFLQVPLAPDGRTAFGQIKALAASEDGTLWIGTENGKVVRLQGEARLALAVSGPVTAISVNMPSGIDIETSREVLRLSASTMQVISRCKPKAFESGVCAAQLQSEMPKAELAAAHLAASQVQTVMRDAKENTWIGSKERGVFRISDSTAIGSGSRVVEEISTQSGLSNDSIWALFQDREGSMWVGTQNGLNRLRFNKFWVMGREAGLLSANLSSVATVGDIVYTGSNLGLNEMSSTGVTNVLRDSIAALATGADSTLLAGTPRGIFAIRGGVQKLLPIGVRATKVTALAQAQGKVLFFYDQKAGLYRWRSGRPAEHVALPVGHREAISVLRADRNGRLWVGFVSGAVAYYEGSAFHFIPAFDQERGQAAHFISVAGDNGLWIASDRGLALVSEEKTISWSRQEGLPGNRVLWAVQGNDNRLWLGYNMGVASVSLADLRRAKSDKNYMLPYNFYDDADGLRGNPELVNNDPVAMSSDGRLWMTTADGLATVNPARLEKNLTPPIAKVLGITADEHAFSTARVVLLPKRTHRLEIEYTGLSFTEPHRVKFRYQLEPFEGRWHEAADRRVATYTNLTPGFYTFRVMAANDDGIWSLEPALLSFRIPAAYYQTRWFEFFCWCLALAVLVTAVKLRIRSVSTQMRGLFEERLKERARLAQDLHDSLIQDVMGISLQLELADELTPASAAGKPVLGRALSLASSAMSQGRSALTSLRVSESTLPEMVDSIVQVSQRFDDPSRVVVSVRTLDPALRLQARIAEEVIQIGREALTNALKHTRGPVELRVVQNPQQFTLFIRDSGPGVNNEVLTRAVSGHFGILGMKERAKRISSKLTVLSREAAGTSISLRVAGHLAYVESGSMRQRLKRSRLRVLDLLRARSSDGRE